MNAPHCTIVCFCTPEIGHFQALRGVVARFVGQGMSAYVFTHASFQRQVEKDGGTFVDLFGKYPIDKADNQSQPIPCRYVSFAGHYADQVIEEVRALDPSLVIYETFSVIGPVVAKALGLPYVNVCANHNANPARLLAALQDDPRVAVSEKCYRSVGRLRNHFGMSDASPFSYVSSLSPLLNIYCEPPQFLDEKDRPAFEPVAFFGCLQERPSKPRGALEHCYFGPRSPNMLRVYVSFGTVIWRYFASEAAAALRAISQASSEMDQVRAVISLGGTELAPSVVASLQHTTVRVVPYVDQSTMLEQADLFVTHHGLNSTHEAVFRRVPMISYPFFWDQPALARRCQELGVAIPLTESLRAAPTVNDVKAAFANFLQNQHRFRENLERACAWEKKTIGDRELVVQRIIDLMQSHHGALAKAA